MGRVVDVRPSIASSYNVANLLAIGLVFHLVLIGSVFDCYFTSPVVKGMERYNAGQAEAKRLVLIVGDGLRADLLFNVDGFHFIPNAPSVVAPYLRSIAERRGAFGVSHTRVPTESRPGHVAIIGGMYEDVSAVTKGWKTNPVDFDSVFNQSSFTFSFGSPDILPMFACGAVPGKVKTWTYHEADEDFTKGRIDFLAYATALDVWVLDQLKILFRNATTDAVLRKQLNSDKIIFFLHLLGLDTTGHSYRPHSKEYMKNVQVVDDVVKQTEKLVSDFYGDDETSYVFTADHGMSVIGNHGDGDPDNTRTPLIAWGRGVRGPLSDSTPSSHDSYSAPWRLGHLLRRDMEQADVAALMASLIGIDWPVNSVGVLPDVDPTTPGYLEPKLGDEARARLALTNSRVILEHYRVKHDMKQARTVFYKPFQPLEDSDDVENIPRRLALLNSMEQFILRKDWNKARETSAMAIKLGLEGLRYLQTYERRLLRAIVTAAYTGWTAYASLFVFRPLDYTGHLKPSPRTFWIINGIALLIFSGFCALFAIQHSPWSFYVYVAFPCFFWREFLIQAVPALRIVSGRQNHAVVRGLFTLLVVVSVMQGMVAGYTHREIWSVGFAIAGVFWPLTWPKGLWKENLTLNLTWSSLCLVTGVFPLLPVDKKENLVAILAGGVLVLVAGWTSFALIPGNPGHTSKLRRSLLLQSALIVLTMIVTASSVSNLQAKLGLPVLNQILGWTLLASASVLPFISNAKHHTRLSKFLTYFMGFGPCFVVLSISVEGLFYVAYSSTLLAWVLVESAVRAAHAGSAAELKAKTGSDGKPRENGAERAARAVVGVSSRAVYRFRADDLRIALFFLFFVQVGFFGTGNVASISSFYLEPVYRLIPIFSPFFMSALLIFKIVAPYVILSVATALLNDALHMPPLSLLLVALTLTDCMTITFFFNVRDTGSWLEIGQSISFFCITSLLLLWSAGICAAGEYLLSDVLGSHNKVE